jgi:hypothetical protein
LVGLVSLVSLVGLVSLVILVSLVSLVWIGWGDTELRSSMRTLAKRHVTRKPFFRHCRAKIMPVAMQIVRLMSKFLQRLKHVETIKYILIIVKSKCKKFGKLKNISNVSKCLNILGYALEEVKHESA